MRHIWPVRRFNPTGQKAILNSDDLSLSFLQPQPSFPLVHIRIAQAHATRSLPSYPVHVPSRTQYVVPQPVPVRLLLPIHLRRPARTFRTDHLRLRGTHDLLYLLFVIDSHCPATGRHLISALLERLGAASADRIQRMCQSTSRSTVIEPPNSPQLSAQHIQAWQSTGARALITPHAFIY